MPTGIYKRTDQMKYKMRMSHVVGWVSTYKKPKSIVTKTGVPTAISRMMKGWTKWGGANHSLLALEDKWVCQCCAEEQTDELPSYFMYITTKDNGELARVCSKCYHLSLIKKVLSLMDLIGLVRPETSFS